MRQVVQSYRSGELSVQDVPAPSRETGGVYVRTLASLVSAGTEKAAYDLAKKSLLGKARERPDLVAKVLQKASRDGVVAAAKAAFAKLDAPLPLGYSCAGEVLEAAGDTGFASGELVACAGARVASHAEFNAVPKHLAARVPAGVSAEDAAFVTLGAIALQGVRIGGPQLGERVAVIGLGLVGQLAAQIARAAGCSVLGIDLSPSRAALAKELGADAACSPDDAEAAMARLSGGRGADVVLVCAATESSAPVELAGLLARDRARVVSVGDTGLSLPRRPYYDKELSFHLSRAYGPGRYDPEYEDHGHDYPIGYVRWTLQRNLEAFLELIAKKQVRVAPLVTHRFPIERAAEAYTLISGGTGEPFLGVLLTYPNSAAPSRSITLHKSDRPEHGRGVGVAVVGAGAFAGGVLVPNLAKIAGVRIADVVSARGLTARHLADKFGAARASTDAAAAWSAADVDAVVIATRHDKHASQTAAALRAGKHVFVEKPLSLDVAGLRDIAAARRDGKREVMVGFNRRFAPLAQELKKALGARAPLVMQVRVNAGPLPPGSWVADPAEGGGRIVGEVCHFVDLCSYLAGAPPVRVSCEGDDENLVATLRFGDGAVASLTYAAGGDPAAPKERLEILGGGLSAVLDDWRELTLSERGERKVARKFVPDKGHRAELVAWVQSLRDAAPPPIAFESLVATTLATFALRESLETGETRAVDVGDVLAG